MLIFKTTVIMFITLYLIILVLSHSFNFLSNFFMMLIIFMEFNLLMTFMSFFFYHHFFRSNECSLASYYFLLSTSNYFFNFLVAFYHLNVFEKILLHIIIQILPHTNFHFINFLILHPFYMHVLSLSH